MNNSQQEASLTGNIRKRDDNAEPPSLDEGEVDNTNELRRKRYTLSRNDRVEDDDYNYLFSSSSSNNNNNNNELSTSTSSTSCMRSPLSSKTNNTNTYASLKRDNRDDTTEEFHDDDAIECNDNNGDDRLLDCDDRIATQQQSTQLGNVNAGGDDSLGIDGNGEISTPGNNTPYMASDTSLLRMGMNAFDKVRNTLDYTVLGQRLWGSRNCNEEEKENDNLSFNGGGDVDMDDDNTSSPPTTTTCSGGSCGSCCGGVCSEETSNPINYDIPHQATDDDIQECRQILIPKKILSIIRDVDGIKQDIKVDEEGAKLTSGLLAGILDESRHKDLRLDWNEVSSDESKEGEEKLEEEENGDGDTLPPAAAVYINGVDVSSLASKQEVTLICNASNILVFGCKINGGSKHPSPKAYKLFLGIFNELYDKETTYYTEWDGHGDRSNGFNYGTNGAVKFFDNLVRLAKKRYGIEFARWKKNEDGTISLLSMVLDEDAGGLERYEDAASRKKSHCHAKNQSNQNVLRKLLFTMLQDIDERNERQERRDTLEEEKQSETEMEKEAIAEAPSANEDEDFMSSDFVPSHDDEYVPTDPHVTSSSEESEQMELEKEDAKEAMEERKKDDEEEEENQIAVAEEGAVSTQSESDNKHKTILSVILMFRLFFELCLLMSNMHSRPEYNVIAMLVVQLLDLSMEQLVVQKNETYQDRWENDNWKRMLGEIVFNAMRILCLQCANCHRTTSGIDPAMLYGWHLDHLLAHWLKKDKCSKYLNGNINRLIFEALKTCLMCVFCHEKGRIPNFAALLNEAMNPSMTYPLGMFGENRRTVREVFQLKEFRSFVLDLRVVGAFGSTTDIPCSWEYIKLSAWHHFHLCLETLTHYRENNWIEWGPKSRHQIAVRIVANIIKILSVKCPNPDCDERFIKIAGIMLSGVQINHRGLKSIQFSDAIIKGIDSFMDECVKGDGDCTCGMDHGVIGNGQVNSQSDHAKLEWVIPSLNVRRVRS